MGGQAGGHSDDEQLARLTRENPEEAIPQLCKRYEPRMRAICWRILRNQASVDDALQDAWVKVLQTSARFDPSRGTLAAWLCKIAWRVAVDRMRQRMRQEAHVHTSNESTVSTTSPEQPQQLSELWIDCCDFAKRKLAPSPSALFVILYRIASRDDEEPLPDDKIAEILGVSVNSIPVFRSSIRSMLTRFFDDRSRN